MTKFCKKCGCETERKKPGKGKKTGRCIPCAVTWSALYRAENKVAIATTAAQYSANNKDRLRARVARWQANNTCKAILTAARARAKKLCLPFNLVLEDIVIPEFCPVLRIRLTTPFCGLAISNGTASLDRIRPELGYVSGNVRIISARANVLKRDGSDEELRLIGLDACSRLR